MRLYLCDSEELEINSMKRIIIGSGNDSSKYCVINIETYLYLIDYVSSHAYFSLSPAFLD